MNDWQRGGPARRRERCPFPDCRCTHTECVKGWLETHDEPSNYQAAVARTRELRQLGFNVAQVSQVLAEEGLDGPVPAAKAVPCPICRPEAVKALADPLRPRQAAMRDIRRRKQP